MLASFSHYQLWRNDQWRGSVLWRLWLTMVLVCQQETSVERRRLTWLLLMVIRSVFTLCSEPASWACTVCFTSEYRWRFGSVGNVVGRINEVNQRRTRLVLGWVTVDLQAGIPSRYATSHPGQLSLAIPPWVGAMSTTESWDVNKTPHDARCTMPWSGSVNWCLAGWGLMKRRSAPPYGPYGSWRTLRVFYVHHYGWS